MRKISVWSTRAIRTFVLTTVRVVDDRTYTIYLLERGNGEDSSDFRGR